jgi:hypothetical protein
VFGFGRDPSRAAHIPPPKLIDGRFSLNFFEFLITDFLSRDAFAVFDVVATPFLLPEKVEIISIDH